MDRIKRLKEMIETKYRFVDEEAKGPYSPLQESNNASQNMVEQSIFQPLPKKRSAHHWFIFITKAIIIAFAFLGVYNAGKFAILSLFQRPVSCSCGGASVAEAASRGCIFTQLSMGWLPPHCIDMELSEEFDQQGPLPGGRWPYWADENGTIPVSLEEISGLPDTAQGYVYTTQEWHIKHCMFSWRKHLRSQHTGVTLEDNILGIGHIAHCEHVMLDGAPLENIWTKAFVELNADRVGGL